MAMESSQATAGRADAETGRIYFFGAGASKADGFPLTGELKYGIAAAILEDPDRFAGLAAHLLYLYGVGDALLRKAADAWRALKEPGVERSSAGTALLPDVTDVLSTLDWMIRDQSTFGPGVEVGELSSLTFGGELIAIRDLVVQALCVSLGQYESLDSAAITRAFLTQVGPQDAVVTTNWDLLLDAARDVQFGTEAADYGTTGNVVVRGGAQPIGGERPLLLKLHGSLSWLYCQRCQRLVIDPRSHIAGERGETARCECTCRFSELIITPGFVREYRNVHLLNIWREALLRLATAAEWVFVGYSLPADDIGVRALLLKARCMRQDLGHPHPQVTVVTGSQGREAVLSRYRVIVPAATLFDGDFGAYVRG